MYIHSENKRGEKFLALEIDNAIVNGHVADKRYFDGEGGGRRDPLNIKRLDGIIISCFTTYSFPEELLPYIFLSIALIALG